MQRDIAMERRPPGVEWWAVPRFLLGVIRLDRMRQENGDAQ
jgi:hypothetical protein